MTQAMIRIWRHTFTHRAPGAVPLYLLCALFHTIYHTVTAPIPWAAFLLCAFGWFVVIPSVFYVIDGPRS